MCNPPLDFRATRPISRPQIFESSDLKLPVILCLCVLSSSNLEILLIIGGEGGGVDLQFIDSCCFARKQSVPSSVPIPSRSKNGTFDNTYFQPGENLLTYPVMVGGVIGELAFARYAYVTVARSSEHLLRLLGGVPGRRAMCSKSST